VDVSGVGIGPPFLPGHFFANGINPWIFPEDEKREIIKMMQAGGVEKWRKK